MERGLWSSGPAHDPQLLAPEGTHLKWYAILWIALGAIMVSVAAVFLLTQGFGPTSTTIIATTGCIGVPFLAFGIWGLYAELKPYHYEPKNRKQ